MSLQRGVQHCYPHLGGVYKPHEDISAHPAYYPVYSRTFLCYCRLECLYSVEYFVNMSLNTRHWIIFYSLWFVCQFKLYLRRFKFYAITYLDGLIDIRNMLIIYHLWFSDSGILQIDKTQTHRLYDTCYKVLKCYSDSAACKFIYANYLTKILKLLPKLALNRNFNIGTLTDFRISVVSS